MCLIKIAAANAALTAAVIGCSKEPQAQSIQSDKQNGQIYTFEAVQADTDPSTKTVIENETAVYWSPKDSIKVFYGTKTSGKFVSESNETVAQTSFVGTFDKLDASINIGINCSDYWGLYPYDKEAVFNDNAVPVYVPAVQAAMEGTFAPDMFPAVAKSNGPSLAFYNVCGGIMFTVSQTGILSVTFKGKNNEDIAGSAKVGMDSNGKPVVQSFTAGVKEISVSAPAGTSFKPGVKYYLVAFPQTFANGFEFTYYKEMTYAVLSSSSSVSISRSSFAKLENKDEDLTFVPRSNSIVFADNLAKAACVAKFDTNEDGELSYAEAAAVTSLDKLFFEDYVNVTSFEELKCFVNVTDLKGCFYGCSKLKTVTIPNNITTIGENAFRDCSALDTLTIPETINIIGLRAFKGCTKLEAITIAASVSEIGISAFDSTLKTATMLGTTPPSIDEDSFVVGTIFYVPKEVLEEYRKEDKWKIHADHIYRIVPEGAVDLGLSVVWHQCSVGASKPSEYGRYFAFGDVVGQTWNGSSWSGGGFSTVPEYEVDANNNLKPAYDAAHVLLGGSWRMPTKAEQDELINNCTTTWTNNYEGTGVAGRILTSTKERYTDKSIFLPAASLGDNNNLYGLGQNGFYWSSTATTFQGSSSWLIEYVNMESPEVTNVNRRYGMTVRPVSE